MLMDGFFMRGGTAGKVEPYYLLWGARVGSSHVKIGRFYENHIV
jgi:hypothetical protein